MKSNSDKKPKKSFEINVRSNNKVIISFYSNIKNTTDEEGNTLYNYNVYELEIQNKENLEKEIEDNYENYLQMAICYEKNKSDRAKAKRNLRNVVLAETDKWLLEDYPNKYPKDAILNYRQALRDFPNQDEFPEIDLPRIEDFI